MISNLILNNTTMKNYIILASTFLFAVIAKAQWVTQASSFANSSYGINSFSIVDANVVWATAYDTAYNTPVRKFTRTINGGTTWSAKNVNGANGWDFTSISAYNKDTAWVSMVDNNNGGGIIYRTNDGGNNWTAQTTALFTSPDGWADFVHFFNQNNGVCVGDSNTGYWEIYTTTNGGSTWTRISANNVPANLTGETANDNAFSVIGNTVWFGTGTGRVYKSVDKGNTWTVSSTGLTDVTRVAFKDSNNGIATDGGLLVKTSDGGTTWTPLFYTGSFFDYDLCYVPGTNGTYVSTGWGPGSDGSSYSTDDGATWVTLDSVGHHAVSFLNASTGWSGGVNTSSTVGGMFKWNGSFVGAGLANKGDLSSLSVDVYPNPFVNQAILTVHSEENAKDMTVELTDIMGNIVYKTHQFDNNSAVIQRGNLANGIYFYQVYQANKVIACGRLMAQ